MNAAFRVLCNMIELIIEADVVSCDQDGRLVVMIMKGF